MPIPGRLVEKPQTFERVDVPKALTYGYATIGYWPPSIPIVTPVI